MYCYKCGTESLSEISCFCHVCGARLITPEIEEYIQTYSPPTATAIFNAPSGRRKTDPISTPPTENEASKLNGTADHLDTLGSTVSSSTAVYSESETKDEESDSSIVCCSNCGAENSSDDSFCYKCGAPLSASEEKEDDIPPAMVDEIEAIEGSAEDNAEQTSCEMPLEKPPVIELPSNTNEYFGERNLCPACGAENATGDKFCYACGTLLENSVKNSTVAEEPADIKSSSIICSKCGTDNESEYLFCCNCGARLT